jgi:hypothetical protein
VLSMTSPPAPGHSGERPFPRPGRVRRVGPFTMDPRPLPVWAYRKLAERPQVKRRVLVYSPAELSHAAVAAFADVEDDELAAWARAAPKPEPEPVTAERARAVAGSGSAWARADLALETGLPTDPVRGLTALGCARPRRPRPPRAGRPDRAPQPGRAPRRPELDRRRHEAVPPAPAGTLRGPGHHRGRRRQPEPTRRPHGRDPRGADRLRQTTTARGPGAGPHHADPRTADRDLTPRGSRRRAPRWVI